MTMPDACSNAANTSLHQSGSELGPTSHMGAHQEQQPSHYIELHTTQQMRHETAGEELLTAGTLPRNHARALPDRLGERAQRARGRWDPTRGCRERCRGCCRNPHACQRLGCSLGPVC